MASTRGFCRSISSAMSFPSPCSVVSPSEMTSSASSCFRALASNSLRKALDSSECAIEELSANIGLSWNGTPSPRGANSSRLTLASAFSFPLPRAPAPELLAPPRLIPSGTASILSATAAAAAVRSASSSAVNSFAFFLASFSSFGRSARRAALPRRISAFNVAVAARLFSALASSAFCVSSSSASSKCSSISTKASAPFSGFFLSGCA
mmetsp:Transcript_14819/g.48547  ORF Transcript_14819/g.48547 Transcript_14819/m.48547 type:complete len:209 (+) Transcript_14819:850-1476(+)